MRNRKEKKSVWIERFYYKFETQIDEFIKGLKTRQYEACYNVDEMKWYVKSKISLYRYMYLCIIIQKSCYLSH